MEKLLLISYYWPPCGGPGSIRPVKFAQYLPEFGIEPIILTRKDIAYHSIDKNLGSDLKNIKIYRTESLDPARILYLLGMHIYKPRKWQVPIKRTLNFPDNKTGWIPFAYNLGQKIEFDYIFVTAPPFSAFITGYFLARKTKKPLILDFRDAWLEFPFLPYKNRFQKHFVSIWEKKVVDCAHLLITVSESIKKSLLTRYPELENKIYTIPNGYDPNDFTEKSFPEKFTISYLGTIRKERNPEPFLIAMERFIKESLISSDKIEIKFIGHVEQEYLKIIKKYPFTRVLGHLSYKEAIKEFSFAHLSLMITTGDEYFFPSRQNEYLACGLPIISCGKSEGLFILKQALSHGYPVKFYEYGDTTGIKNELSNFYAQYKEKLIKRAVHPFPEYTRKNLTKELAELIKCSGH